MRILMVPVLVLSVATVGCGDKSKKKTVATTAPAVADVPGPEGESQAPVSEEINDEPKQAANLQDVVYFAFDASALDDEARAKLQDNAKWMGEDETRVLTIEGHTDETGTSDYNLALGERRARVTRDYLVRLGVDASRVQIITYGEERPASGQDSLNRRSVFVATRK